MVYKEHEEVKNMAGAKKNELRRLYGKEKKLCVCVQLVLLRVLLRVCAVRGLLVFGGLETLWLGV